MSDFRRIWNDAGIPQPNIVPEENMFRFGNGASELSTESIEMPVCLPKKSGVIRADIVQGDAPLSLSRPAMKKLSAEMDFSRLEDFASVRAPSS